MTDSQGRGPGAGGALGRDGGVAPAPRGGVTCVVSCCSRPAADGDAAAAEGAARAGPAPQRRPSAAAADSEAEEEAPSERPRRSRRRQARSPSPETASESDEEQGWDSCVTDVSEDSECDDRRAPPPPRAPPRTPPRAPPRAPPRTAIVRRAARGPPPVASRYVDQWGAPLPPATWLPPAGGDGLPVVVAPQRLRRGDEEALRRRRPQPPAPLPPEAYRPLDAKPARVCCCCPLWVWATAEEDAPPPQQGVTWASAGEPYAVTVARAINSMSTASARRELLELLRSTAAG